MVSATLLRHMIRVDMQAGGKEGGAGPGPSSQQQQQLEQQQKEEGTRKHIGTNTMGMVLDLLCFCVQHHGYRYSCVPLPAAGCSN